MGRLRHRHPVGRVEDLHENVVAEGLVLQRRRPRLDDQSVSMQVGRVTEQIGLAGIGIVIDLGRVELRQLIHQPDLERVALLQGQSHAAVIGHRGIGRAGIAGCGPPADLIDPAGRVHGRAGRRSIGDGRDRLGPGDHQQVEDTMPAPEYRRLGQIVSGCCCPGEDQSGQQRGCRCQYPCHWLVQPPN